VTFPVRYSKIILAFILAENVLLKLLFLAIVHEVECLLFEGLTLGILFHLIDSVEVVCVIVFIREHEFIAHDVEILKLG